MGYNPPRNDAALVHYTIGGPYFDAYRECEYSKEWFAEHAEARLAEVKKVPREPTKAMLDAGYAAAAFPRDAEICIAMWKAMFDATLSAGKARA